MTMTNKKNLKEQSFEWLVTVIYRYKKDISTGAVGRCDGNDGYSSWSGRALWKRGVGERIMIGSSVGSCRCRI